KKNSTTASADFCLYQLAIIILAIVSSPAFAHTIDKYTDRSPRVRRYAFYGCSLCIYIMMSV
ncbi:hypothetical protein, partial [Chitinophaga sp. sic0106]|uniref:hypothetical protein n=1 Tax=Chitinophaga sp. sic0106 TaxID=2854785 RepID=UPI001C456AB1